MNTDLDLNSSVELYFKTDYLPLDRLAGKGQVDRIKVNTLNPEEDAARKAREARTAEARKSEWSGMSEMDKNLLHTPAPPPKNESKPTETKPADKKPADTKAADQKPTDTKAAEKKPAVAADT